MMFILSLISNLSAQEAGVPKPGGAAGIIGSPLVMIGLMVVVFYFFMIRPQQKQRKKHAEFLASIKKGDEVVTASGIVGTVYSVSDRIVTLEVDENAKMKVLKGMISASAKEAVLENK